MVRLRSFAIAFCVLALVAAPAIARQSGTDQQRLEILRSGLESMRAQLKGALASLPKSDKDEKKDSPRARLGGLEKEVAALLSEITDLRGKVDRSERYEAADIGKFEASNNELKQRVESGLRETAGDRTASAAATTTHKKKKGKFFGLFGGGADEDKYEELVGTVATGRDRVLFEDATKEIRKGRFDVGRLLFSTIINAYPDSNYLPLAKLAIADTFYLEGSTSSLIQAAASYQDWLTFFPSDTLADRVMLKIAESEMRQMNIPGRSAEHSRRAEQRLKVILQQYPKTALREDVVTRLNEVQENLAMNNKMVGDWYRAQYKQRGRSGLKGAQSRYREIVEKYKNFSQLDEVLFYLGVTYMDEEETDEAAKLFQRIAKDFPNSEFYEKAIEQLKVIGAAVPEPDPTRKDVMASHHSGMMTSIKAELFGMETLTVDDNGVIIWKKLDKNEEDPITKAIANQGQLPDSRIPVAPSTRTPKPAQPGTN
jgi:outer membrane protein assembly factor BamD